MIPDDPTRFDGDPTPQEIADLAAEIRAGWTDDERARRSMFFAGKRQPSQRGYRASRIRFHAIQFGSRGRLRMSNDQSSKMRL